MKFIIFIFCCLLSVLAQAQNSEIKQLEEQVETADLSNLELRQSYITMAQLQEQAGEREEAMYSYRRAIQTGCANSYIYLSVAKQEITQEQYSLALKYINLAAKAKKNNTEALYLRAFVYLQMGLEKKAEQEAKKVIQQDKNYAAAYFLLAEIQFMQNKHKKAMNSLEKGMLIQPELIKQTAAYHVLVAK